MRNAECGLRILKCGLRIANLGWRTRSKGIANCELRIWDGGSGVKVSLTMLSTIRNSQFEISSCNIRVNSGARE
jgi:hypothetical protein